MGYLKCSVVLLLGSCGVILLAHHFLIHCLKRSVYLDVYSVGYSCVVFGLMTILSQFEGSALYNSVLPPDLITTTKPTPETRWVEIFGIPLPKIFAPLSSLLLTQLLIPNASFIGHFSGIVIGFLLLWNAFYWVSDSVFWSCIIWGLIGLLYNLKTTTDIHVPFFEMRETLPPELIQENGTV